MLQKAAIFSCPCCGKQDPTLSFSFEDIGELFSNSEQELWEALTQYPGKTISRERIIMHLWGHKDDGGPDTAENIVAVILNRMRKKLEGLPVDIENTHGKGWRVVVRGAESHYVNVLDELGRIRKLDDLQEEVIGLAVSRASTKVEAARWLGMGETTLRDYLNGITRGGKTGVKRRIFYREHVRTMTPRGVSAR